MDNRFAVILAGGSGTRFWPLSRDERPKQLLDLFGQGTLLAQTVARLEGAVPSDNILVLTNERQRDAVRQAIPQVPAENIVAEPSKRDTAPAVALGIGLVARRHPAAEMAVLPADHLIRDGAAFRRVLCGAIGIARASGKVVTIGVKPSWPCPSYGYIERGPELPGLATTDGIVPREVLRFREKPGPELAQEFVRQDAFAWNAGMFIWTVEAVRRELQRHAPALADFVDRIAGAEDCRTVLQERYAALPQISIDFALMEKLQGSCNVEAGFDWDDVGGWLSVAGYLGEDGSGNRCRGEMSGLRAQGNVVFSNTGQHVALLGVSGLIVVQTADALLIAHQSAAEQIKHLVEKLPSHLR